MIHYFQYIIIRHVTARSGGIAFSFVSLFFCVSLAHAERGGVFSGPTRLTGASIFWNPAATMLQRGTFDFYIEGSANLTQFDYLRAGTNPQTGRLYDEVHASSWAPNLKFMTVGDTRWPQLKWLSGGFSPLFGGVNWPKDGPQRYFGTKQYIVSYTLSLGLLWKPSDKFGLAFIGGPAWGKVHQESAIDFGAFANRTAGASIFPLEDPLLEGYSTLDANGWSRFYEAGVWTQPTPWLRVGACFRFPQHITLHGKVKVKTSKELQDALAVTVVPEGYLDIPYTFPWEFLAGVEFLTNKLHISLLLWWTQDIMSRTLIATIHEANPRFLEGEQLSIRQNQNDWVVGSKVRYNFNDDWAMGLDFRLDPRNVPNEVLTATNLKLTTLHFGTGVHWKNWEFSYVHIYSPTLVNRESILNPMAPTESGLALPSGNGRYNSFIRRFVVSYAGAFE